ncbi:MAG: hypothetical protein LAT76_07185 [Schleiferiaceae bacterium]|nr:hypothetical protein [Schleiferiaceae bacterium]
MEKLIVILLFLGFTTIAKGVGQDQSAIAADSTNLVIYQTISNLIADCKARFKGVKAYVVSTIPAPLPSENDTLVINWDGFIPTNREHTPKKNTLLVYAHMEYRHTDRYGFLIRLRFFADPSKPMSWSFLYHVAMETQENGDQIITITEEPVEKY